VEQDTEQIKPEAFLQHNNKLIARTKTDLRVSSNKTDNAITNILITNIRNANDDSLLYKETAGPRAGRGTIYEVATVEPFTGPFGSVEYFKLLLRRTENQTVGDYDSQNKYSSFNKQMNNIVQYAFGFLDGVKKVKRFS
jgi:hypothetical protein